MAVVMPLAREAPVGLPAYDFVAETYFPDTQTAGQVRLRDLLGHWILLFFYSSDFTFV